jgi:hypothetical protein
MISPIICLGLVLAWTRTRGNVFSLQLDFGLSHSCLNLWLRFGMRIVVNILCEHPLARVRMPSREEVTAFQQATAAKYPSLTDVWGTLDGLNLNLQSTKDDKVQSIFYNGWTHGHYVSNVFVFGMDGCIRICGLNAPGTMHNSTLADYGNVYEKLEKVFLDTGGKVVVDSAFRLASNDFIIKSGQNVPVGNPQLVLRARDATSIRQASEWGMRQFQDSFPRMKDEFCLETQGERRIILLLVVYLFNYRTNLVGCNQVRSTYMPHLEANALAARSIF